MLETYYVMLQPNRNNTKINVITCAFDVTFLIKIFKFK